MFSSSKMETVFPIIVPTNKSLKSYNFFLYETGSSLLLIDAGMDSASCWESLLTTLRTNGYTIQNLSAILLTHHHIDHIGLINHLVSIHPVPVYAHPAALPRLVRDPEFLERRVDFFQILYREAGCAKRGDEHVAYLQQALEKNKGQALEADLHPLDTSSDIYHLKIIETPGHAPDQVAYYHPEAKWLFGGDLLINHISSNALMEYNPHGESSPLLSHVHSFQLIDMLSIDIVFPGHGELIQEHRKLIQQRMAGIEAKANKLKSYISEGIHTPNELAQTFYPKRYDKQFPLVMSEIIGHLEYLRAKERVEKYKNNGVWHYQTI